MIALDEYARLKREVEQLDREINQAKGARKELLETARKRFGKRTVKEVEDLVEERRAARVSAHKKYVHKYKEFLQKWRKTIARLKKNRNG